MKHTYPGKPRTSSVLFPLFALSMLFVPGAFAQGRQDFIFAGSQAIGPCHDGQLKVRHVTEDAAMGGVRSAQYAFTNTSSTPCVLKGYPRVELLNKSGRLARRAKNGLTRMGDEYEKPPQAVTLEPSKTATFWVGYMARGAGSMGGPCPTYSKVRITAPGTKRGLVIKDDIELCSGLEVSPVLSEPPQEPTGALRPELPRNNPGFGF